VTAAREGFEKLRQFIAEIDFLLTHPPTALASPHLISAKAKTPLPQGEGSKAQHSQGEGSGKVGGDEAQDRVLEIEDMDEELQPYRDKFKAFMDDDFNAAGAIAAIFEMIKYCRQTLAEGDMEKDCLELMRKSVIDLCAILGLSLEIEDRLFSRRSAAIEFAKQLISERETARNNKDFKRSDEIRRQLAEQGIEIEDTAHGTKWKSRT
jgi:cysteinyl-tRNA synthetase